MSDEQQLLDRLVDGELSPEARRELLQRMDQETGGWRRCALAFLEAQSWGEDFSAWLNEPAKRSSTSGSGLEPTVSAATANPTRNAQQGTVLRRSASRRWIDRVGTLLAVAASFMIAFGLGVASRRIPNSDGPEGLAAHGGQTSAAAVATAPVTSTSSGLNPPGELAPTELASALDAALARAAEEDTGEASPIWLPSGLPGDESLSGDEPSPALPAYVKRALERSGHAIEQQHELWPVQLENGSRALVPVERVKVRYIGNDFK